MTEALRVGRLIEALDDEDVAYVVVGSVAAMAHGVPDVTPSDLDIVPATEPANLGRLADTLAALGADVPAETGEWQLDDAGERAWISDGVERRPRALDPNDPSSFDRSFATPFGPLDVVPDVAGRYADLRARATPLTLERGEAWVAHPLDVLAGMTRPRRAKDAARVRALRAVALATPGVGFVGLATNRFAAMVGLFRDLIGLDVIREGRHATWFRLGTDAELHVYADTDPDHAFFTTGPVVGLRVDDVEETRRRLADAGCELLTEVERTDTAAWCHFRAPDGTVLEIIGPARTDATGTRD